MSRGILALVLAAGCFSVPPYEPEDAVKYAADGTGATVTGVGFALHFADGPGFHFPDSLMIGKEAKEEVIGREEMAGCFKEDEVGFRFSPTSRISPTGGAKVVRNDLELALGGPAVVQVKLHWQTELGCNNTRKPGGTSTFTVFPDGKIVRHDFISDPIKTEISPFECACLWDTAGPSEYRVLTFATYWALARARFRELLRGDMVDDPQSLPLVTDSVIPNTDKSCVQATSNEYQVTFAWRNPDLTMANNSTIRGGDALVGFGRDLRRGASSLGDLDLNNSGAVFIGSKDSNCTKEFVRAEEFAYPVMLKVNGKAKKDWMAEDRDGIYGGDSGTGAGIDLDKDSAELSGEVRTPFAVWLRFPRPADAVRATRANATGAWYMPQRVDDRSWIVWFRDPLKTGDSITVEPR